MILSVFIIVGCVSLENERINMSVSLRTADWVELDSLPLQIIKCSRYIKDEYNI